MSATESGSDVTAEVIDLCVNALVGALTQRGLTAEVRAGTTVVARNNATEPDKDDPCVLVSPGLRQTVACRADTTGRLSWFWAWSGPTPDAPPDLEYLGPAGHIDDAADRIVNVLRLKDNGLEPAT